MNLQNGVISGNKFSANVIIGSLATGDLGEGVIQGHFFGPDAKEFGFTIILYDQIDSDDEFSMFTGAGIGKSQ